MDEYKLQPNESVLFKCNTYDDTEILLTNLNLVIIKKIKKVKKRKKGLLSENQSPLNIYPVEDIKIYKDVPQIKSKNNTVEIYLTSTEISIDFYSRGDAYKFTNTAVELLTGKNTFARGAEKFKNAIDVVDDTLGINTVDTVKNVVENGVAGGILGIIGQKRKSKGQSGIKKSFNVLQQAIDSNSTENRLLDNKNDNPNEINDRVEKLKKLKSLLDEGILTQEEFDRKKEELLNTL